MNTRIMKFFKQLFESLALATIFLMMAFAIVYVCNFGCITKNTLDQSQRTLTAVTISLSTLDHIVSRIEIETEEIQIQVAVDRAQNGECFGFEDAQTCVVRLLRDERRAWYEVTDALEAMREVLELWETINLTWDESGERPQNIYSMVCIPFGAASEQLRSRLTRAGVEIPVSWRGILEQVTVFCTSLLESDNGRRNDHSADQARFRSDHAYHRCDQEWRSGRNKTLDRSLA